MSLALPAVVQAQDLVEPHVSRPVTPAVAPAPRAPLEVTQAPASGPSEAPDSGAGELVTVSVGFKGGTGWPDDWGKVFPVMLDDGSSGACRIESGQHFLDQRWLLRCLDAVPAPGGGSGSFEVPAESLVARVQRANQIFYDNGYVDSGIQYFPAVGGQQPAPPRIQVIGGILEGGGKACSLSWPDGTGTPALTRRYVRQRLMRGCGKARPFNIYLLGRDFARLADDRDPWICKLDLSVVPSKIGVAGLTGVNQPSGVSSTTCPVRKQAGNQTAPPAIGPVTIVPKSPFTATVGVANDRSPSIGSFRSFANLGFYGIAGASLDLEGGATDGALDGTGVLTVALTPRLTFVVSGQYNQAEVVDPILRPLGIKSRSWGGDASIYYGAIQCPITRIYGDPLSSSARQPFAGSPFGECRLAVRLPGDGPKGWSPGRDLTFGLTLSHTVARTFLLGQPFSFSPGSVDGLAYVTALRGSVDLLERGRAGRDGERGWTLAARVLTSVGLDGSASDIAGLDNPSPHFLVVRGQLGFAYQLGLGHMTLESRLSGQWSQKPLYTTERFSVGGVNSVRGYPESALLADRALVGSIGLDRNFSLARKTRPEDSTSADLSRFRLMAFADVAVATTLDPLSRRTDWLASVGGGIAWIPSSAAELSFQYGRRLGASHSGPEHSLADDGIYIAVRVQPLRFLCLLKKNSSVRCLDN